MTAWLEVTKTDEGRRITRRLVRVESVLMVDEIFNDLGQARAIVYLRGLDEEHEYMIPLETYDQITAAMVCAPDREVIVQARHIQPEKAGEAE